MWPFFVVSMYLLGNIFIIFRVLSWLKVIHKPLNHQYIKVGFLTIYLLCASTPIIAFFLPKGEIQRGLQIFANCFLGVYVYMFLTALIFCIIYLIFKLFVKKKEQFFKARKYLYTTCCISLVFVIFMSIYGMIHANVLTLKKYDVTVRKEAKVKDVNIVLFADTHLGYSTGLPTIQKLVKKCNQLKPDLILIAGDIFDNDYDAINHKEKIIKELKKLKTNYGIYAVFGNHDIKEKLFAGFSIQKIKDDYRDPRMEEFLEKANINILDDEVTTIADSFSLIGRLDYKKTGKGTKKRKTMKELTKDLDKTLPRIVLEHEPKDLAESKKEDVSLHLAGHTHDGQFFPLNITGGFFYENPYGIYQKGNMTSIVTSGVGVYGPDMRVGTNSEIVQIKLHFKKD